MNLVTCLLRKQKSTSGVIWGDVVFYIAER